MMAKTRMELMEILPPTHHLRGVQQKCLDLLLFSVEFTSDESWNNSGQRDRLPFPVRMQTLMRRANAGVPATHARR